MELVERALEVTDPIRIEAAMRDTHFSVGGGILHISVDPAIAPNDPMLIMRPGQGIKHQHIVDEGMLVVGDNGSPRRHWPRTFANDVTASGHSLLSEMRGSAFSLRNRPRRHAPVDLEDPDTPLISLVLPEGHHARTHTVHMGTGETMLSGISARNLFLNARSGRISVDTASVDRLTAESHRTDTVIRGARVRGGLEVTSDKGDISVLGSRARLLDTMTARGGRTMIAGSSAVLLTATSFGHGEVSVTDSAASGGLSVVAGRGAVRIEDVQNEGPVSVSGRRGSTQLINSGATEWQVTDARRQTMHTDNVSGPFVDPRTEFNDW